MFPPFLYFEQLWLFLVAIALIVIVLGATFWFLSGPIVHYVDEGEKELSDPYLEDERKKRD